MKRVLFIVLIILTTKVCVNAAGTDNFTFLKIPQGVKATSIGNAFTALADDPTATYWNPSGICQIHTKEIYSSYSNWLQGATIADLRYIQNFSQFAIGVSLLNIGYGSFNETTIDYPQGTGKIFSPNDCLLTLTYAYNHNDNFYSGINFNLINSNLGIKTSSGQSVDLGMLYKTPEIKGLSFGSTYKGLGQGSNFPSSLSFGTAYSRDMNDLGYEDGIACLSMDYVSRNERTLINLGFQYKYKDIIEGRIGLSDNRTSLGVGIKYSKYIIDLSFVPYDDLGATYRVALDYKL